MGLTKQYLSYKTVGNFNILASTRPNVQFVTLNSVEGRYVAVGAAENTIIWDLRLGDKVLELQKGTQEVTYIQPSPDRVHLAIGYVDGNVDIFDLMSRECVFSLALHRTSITCLRYDSMGMQLISGGLDTDLILCDIITQSGKCRLSGHNAPITAACFLEPYENIVISSSKDTQIKFWNTETQCCFKTIVDNRTEVWTLALMNENSLLVSGSGENHLNVYKITKNNPEENVITMNSDNIEDETGSPINCNLIGTINRAGRGRTVSLVADHAGRILGCHGTDDLIELFVFCSPEESLKRLSKRLKKLTVEEGQTNSKEITLSDEIRRLTSIKTKNKLKSIDLLMGNNNELRIVSTFSNNSIQMYSLNTKEKRAEHKVLRAISQQGHHSEVRSVSFSSDNLAIASGSGESLKIWNRPSMICLRTIETGYVLSTSFVPGDRHALVGLKTGQLLIVDIMIGEILEEIPAHTSELWCITLLPDLRGCVTGGGDQTVKVWSFELITDANKESGNKILSLLHKNTLKLEETVLNVKISQNSKFIAVALLDSTVKIFFLDSFKFYLSLYGHKLPVTCMDISDDSAIIATGSADRNVKIWGMDFGDCHRSLFAHDDSVMGLQFIPKTHQFFTCGKDGKIKQWDGDSFEKIMTFTGHIGEAYSLSVSPNGKFFVSCGSDRVLRLYERSEEIIVLQDAQEQEREDMENRTLATGEETTVPGLPNLKLASKKTVGSEKCAESILECLDISKMFDNDKEINKDLHPLMIAYDVKNTSDFLLVVLSKVRPSDLEEALVLLPFSSVCDILKKLTELADSRKDYTELICKVILFIFRIHQRPIISNLNLLPIITKMLNNLETSVNELRDIIGLNYYTLQLLQRDIENKQGIEIFKEVTKMKKQKDKFVKKRELAKRLYVQMN